MAGKKCYLHGVQCKNKYDILQDLKIFTLQTEVSKNEINNQIICLW